jgi:hypothetical protein
MSKQILWSTMFFSENLPVYEVMWKNNVDSDRQALWRMRFAGRITKARQAHKI